MLNLVAGMCTVLDGDSGWPERLFSPAKETFVTFKTQSVLLRGTSAVTVLEPNLPVKNRTFQRCAFKWIFMSLSSLCDRSKWVFSIFHRWPWRLYWNAIHIFFPADLFDRFKAPHLSVWAHPGDLARSLTGDLARSPARTSRLPGMDREPPLACCDLYWRGYLFKTTTPVFASTRNTEKNWTSRCEREETERLEACLTNTEGKG